MNYCDDGLRYDADHKDIKTATQEAAAMPFCNRIRPRTSAKQPQRAIIAHCSKNYSVHIRLTPAAEWGQGSAFEDGCDAVRQGVVVARTGEA